MQKKHMKGMAGLAVVGLAMAGCSASGETTETPTATATETVTATETATPSDPPSETSSQSRSADAEWLLLALEARADVEAARDILMARDFNCPSPDPEDPPTDLLEPSWVQCEDDGDSAIHYYSADTDAEEMFEPGLDDGRGLVYTDRFAVTSEDSNQIDIAAEVLAPLDAVSIDPS